MLPFKGQVPYSYATCLSRHFQIEHDGALGSEILQGTCLSFRPAYGAGLYAYVRMVVNSTKPEDKRLTCVVSIKKRKFYAYVSWSKVNTSSKYLVTWCFVYRWGWRDVVCWPWVKIPSRGRVLVSQAEVGNLGIESRILCNYCERM